jgi:soluble lytic murein transglycosylase-like protein
MNIDWSKLSQEQLDIAEKVVLEAQKQGVDENLALSMANIESGFKASAKSPRVLLVLCNLCLALLKI